MNKNLENKIDGQRFKTGIEFQKELLTRSRTVQSRMLDNLPSNYSKNVNTNLAEFYRAVAEEFSRLEFSASDINEDKFAVSTRSEYLFLILGDLLFLGERSINDNLSDVDYRDFLIKVRNGYLGGSRPGNIESSVSDILGFPVILKEVYQSLRLDSTSYTIKDTHKMFFDILMDDNTITTDIGSVLNDLKFFIDLIKPAHVLYDTRLVWSESIDKRGDCTPEYDTSPMLEAVYFSGSLYVVTYASDRVYKTEVETGEEGWETGTISSIDYVRKLIKTSDNRTIVYTASTVFYSRDALGTDTIISPSSFSAGEVIKYYAVKDGHTTSEIITDTWSFSGVVSSIDVTQEIITLNDGSKLVYNSDLLVYTRDGYGEYRINVSDIVSNNEIVFPGTLYTEAFNFLSTPDIVLDNTYKQFDQAIIDRPSFQKNVKKVLKTRDSLSEGYHVIVEDGVAKVISVSSNFYSREGSTPQAEKIVTRYSLYINDVYQEGAQFSTTEPEEQLSTSQAKQVFIDQFGYSQLENPFTVFEIKISQTAKLFESNDDTTIEAIDGSTQTCDSSAECTFIPLYEDTRKYWTWPEVRLTSGFIVLVQNFSIESTPGGQNVPAYYAISEEPNQYVMPLLPVMNSLGNPASASDIVVYVNGLKVNDSVVSLDPWTGVVTLNYLPPFNSTVRVDYYHSERYPYRNTYIKQIKTNINGSAPSNDMGAEYSVIGEESVVNKLLWPFPVNNIEHSGDDLDYQVNKFPILSNKGKLATVDDVVVSVGSIVLSGVIDVTVGSKTVVDVLADFLQISVGDTIIIEAPNYLDKTLRYTVESIIDANTIDISSAFPNLNDGETFYSYSIIKFIEVPESIQDIKPLLGHIRLNFLPPSNSFIRFDFYYTHYNRNYSLVPDELSGGTPDTVFNSYSNLTSIPDLGPGYDSSSPYTDDETVLKIGYRYRAFNLSSSSVLNSSDTLTLNSYVKKGLHGSFKNRSGILNDYGIMFSPEYLTDTDKNIILNDKYLEKGIPATTQLYKGTPPFVKSFSDEVHYKKSEYAVESDTYEGHTEVFVDLQAGFTIVSDDTSGDIRYNKVCDFKENGSVNLHSDLKIIEFPNENGKDVPLSTITEGSRTLPISTTMIEQYYPNRELRINDYLDFINKVPEDIITGSILVLKGSKIIKSHSVDLRNFRVGDTISVQSVAVLKADRITKVNKIFYENQIYVITHVFDYQTAEINKPFLGFSGSYEYQLTRDTIFNTDVLLNEVQRKLVFNGKIGHTYALPDSILMHYPGYGDTGISYVLNFPDPDQDPYPRNPNNQNIQGLPTGDPNVLFTNYTGQESTVPLLSEIIYADGSTYATGMSGYTGPSGAVNLGLTGPVGYPNPRIYSDDDDPIYNIPSGDSGIFMSYSESEYRVKWRNWDQDMIILGFGEVGAITGQNGIMVEDPVNMLDDLGDGIKKSFWSIDKYALGETGLVELYFFGSVIESSESVEASVPKNAYSDALIPLDSYQAMSLASVYRQGSYTGIQSYIAEFSLDEPSYEHRQLIVRELLHDNNFRVTEVRQYAPI